MVVRLDLHKLVSDENCFKSTYNFPLIDPQGDIPSNGRRHFKDALYLKSGPAKEDPRNLIRK